MLVGGTFPERSRTDINASVGSQDKKEDHTHRPCENVAWCGDCPLDLVLQEAGLEDVLYPGGVLEVPIRALQSRYGVVRPQSSLHLWEDYKGECSVSTGRRGRT